MKTRRIFSLSVGFGVIAIVAGVLLLVPSGRDVVQGVINNEPFANGRPMSYWIRELQDGDSANRRTAINAVADMGRDGTAALPALEQIAKNDDIALRSWAICKGMGSIGPAAVPALCELIKERSVRTVVVTTMGQIGPEGKAAVPALIKALKDEYPITRTMACAALGNMGAAAQDAVPGLIEALKDRSVRVRNEAGIALQRVDPKAAAKAGIN